MKTAFALLLWLGILGVVGCRQPDPAPAGGVSVAAPFVGVNVAPGGATSVAAPGVRVNTP